MLELGDFLTAVFSIHHCWFLLVIPLFNSSQATDLFLYVGRTCVTANQCSSYIGASCTCFETQKHLACLDKSTYSVDLYDIGKVAIKGGQQKKWKGADHSKYDFPFIK
jgi:hypothetical protein